MRNVFDQYTQPENRLTHALICTLDADRSLLKPFLKWAGCDEIPHPNRLYITEQQIPGKPVSGDAEDGIGLPDGCVYSELGWAMLIESKISSPVSLDQLRRHIATAKRHEFDNPFLLLLSIDKPPKHLPERTVHKAWRDVYAWFRKHSGSSHWARTLTEYMEIFESRMIAEEYSIRGTLTMFDGLRFTTDNPYTYREGKRLIRLLGDELQQRKDLHKLGIDPKGQRRSAITGSGENRVWDYLPLKVASNAQEFTHFPHLDMGISRDEAVATLTIANGIKGGFRKKLKALGQDGFIDLLKEVEHSLRPILKASPESKAMVYALQRHYPSQRSAGIKDARLEADLRTITAGGADGVKYQPEWVESIYQVMTNKRSNIQLGIEVIFSYECKKIQSVKAVDLFAKSFVAMKPMIDFVLE